MACVDESGDPRRRAERRYPRGLSRAWICAGAALATMIAATACDDEPVSQIDVLVLDAPPGLADRPDTLRLDVTPLDGTEPAGSRSWSEPASFEGDRLAPWTTRIGPFASDHAGRVLYRFRATAMRDGAEMVHAQARLVFVPGARLVLPLRFATACIGRSCGPDETCFDGVCVDDFVPACSLLEGRAPAFCRSMDASVRDLGPARDMGGGDLGPIDVGPRDVGSPDVGPVDAAPLDTGPMDAGRPVGPTDAGPLDTGPRDTGPRDMGPPDAGPVCGVPVSCDEARRCECDPFCTSCDSTCNDGTDVCTGTCTAGQTCSITVIDSADSFFDCENDATCALDVRGGDNIRLTCRTGATCSVTCTAAEPDRCDLVCTDATTRCSLDCGGRAAADCALDCGARPETRCDGGVSTCGSTCP